MSVYETTVHPLPHGSVATFRVVSFFETILDRFATWHSARVTARELHALSDAQLADVGLTRGKIKELAGELAGR
jgi:uncharacterized protein YjiS (DUF1127 family)